ncbi:MAG: arylsulfatase [Spirochaetaceae bacterium]|nr:MAG: arylsulfatase [Spirochaetaceae bacterium]
MNSKPKTKPNIIYVLADDMGYGDLSCLNENCAFPTPAFDRLAAEGMTFTDAHASSAVCTPSRYGILTGRYNWRSRLKSGVLGGYSSPLIEDGRDTVAALVKRAGYRTACIGKWHLGLEWSRTTDAPEAPDFATTDGIDYAGPVKKGPTEYGFDYFFGIAASLDMPPYVYIENDRATALPDHETEGTGMRMWRKGPTAPDFRHEEVLPTLTKKALEFIDDAGKDPFFLYFPLPAPHTPILPVGEFVGKSGTNAYGDFVLMCDDVIAQILRRLEKNGIAENTIVVYTSDNGCSPRADYEALAKFGHNPSYIFRGTKADIYEGGHRVPLLVRWPELIRAGSISDETVCLTDLYATVADILGQTYADDAAEDSVSHVPIWSEADRSGPVRDAVVHHSIDGSFSIRTGKWKLELCPGSGGWSDPRPGEEPADAPPAQLYDLEADIRERRNLFAERPDVVERLTALLVDYVRNGRSTPGAPQKNTGPEHWERLWFTPESGS